MDLPYEPVYFQFSEIFWDKISIPFNERVANCWRAQRNAKIRQARQSTTRESRQLCLRHARESHTTMLAHLRAARERPHFWPDHRTRHDRQAQIVLKLCSEAFAVDEEQATQVIKTLTGGYEAFCPSSSRYSLKQLDDVANAFLRIIRSSQSAVADEH